MLQSTRGQVPGSTTRDEERALLLLGIVGSADLASAQGYFYPCDDVAVSQSTVNLASEALGPPLPPAPGSQSDGPRFGNPTSSSIQRGYNDVSAATALAALSIGGGGFGSVSSVGITNEVL